MKNIFSYASMAVVLGGMMAQGQLITADPNVQAVNFKTQATSSSYAADEIKIVGTLTSGQTSKPVAYTKVPQYRAFVFEGNGHDQVDITVTGAGGKAFIAVADSTLTPIATGTGRLSAALPFHGTDTEAFYILFRTSTNQPGQMTVHLKKTPASAKPADATR